MDITYTTSSVEWEYCGEKKKYIAKGVEFASIEGNKIYIEICGDFGYEYRYINLVGENIIWYRDNIEQVIFFISEDDKKIVKLQGLKDVAVMNDKIFVLTFVTDNGEILEYSKHATMLKKYLPPVNYSFYRFPKMNNDLTVICQGNEFTIDSFGRNDWKFKYNNRTECWEKESLSY